MSLKHVQEAQHQQLLELSSGDAQCMFKALRRSESLSISALSLISGLDQQRCYAALSHNEGRLFSQDKHIGNRWSAVLKCNDVYYMPLDRNSSLLRYLYGQQQQPLLFDAAERDDVVNKTRSQLLLDKIMTYELLNVKCSLYMQSWGEPLSLQRLDQLVLELREYIDHLRHIQLEKHGANEFRAVLPTPRQIQADINYVQETYSYLRIH